MPAFGLTLVGAYVVIVAATGIFWSLQCLAIRLFIRLRIHGPLSWDDYCCAIATVLAVTQSSLAILGTRYGLGHRQDTLQTATVNRQRLLGWINNQFYLATLCFSMLSVCFLIVRVTKRTEQVRLAYAIAILTVLWAVISMPTVALDCAVPHPWIISPRSRYTNIVRSVRLSSHNEWAITKSSYFVSAVSCLARRNHSQSRAGDCQRTCGYQAAMERTNSVASESGGACGFHDQAAVSTILTTTMCAHFTKDYMYPASSHRH
jgi:hypothetical protein